MKSIQATRGVVGGSLRDVVRSLTIAQQQAIRFLASEVPGLIGRVHKNTWYSLVRKGIAKKGKLTRLGESINEAI